MLLQKLLVFPKNPFYNDRTFETKREKYESNSARRLGILAVHQRIDTLLAGKKMHPPFGTTRPHNAKSNVAREMEITTFMACGENDEDEREYLSLREFVVITDGRFSFIKPRRGNQSFFENPTNSAGSAKSKKRNKLTMS